MDKLKNNSLQFVCYFLLTVGATLYLLQAFTPFRLTSDSIYYLTMADAAATGHGFVGHNQPIGYPLFVFLLIKARIFSSATMVIANCLFFGIGLVLSFRTLLTLGYSRVLSLGACLVTLFSFTAVKHVTQGMSDFLFFALSASVCWTITLKTHWKWIALPVLVLCAVEVRFMGLALAFPVAVTVWPYVKKYRAGLIVAVFVSLVTFAVGLWVGRQYFLDNLELLHRFGISHFVLRSLVLHAQDFGEFVFNVPLTKLPSLRIPVLLIGACTMFLFFYGVLTTWRRS